jgi:hypothetical protein
MQVSTPTLRRNQSAVTVSPTLAAEVLESQPSHQLDNLSIVSGYLGQSSEQAVTAVSSAPISAESSDGPGSPASTSLVSVPSAASSEIVKVQEQEGEFVVE